MSTDRQIQANRLNAQRSTGPRSVEGKSASRMNALKSGIDAKSQIIRGEDPAALELLTAEYMNRFQPVTPEERQYVDSLVRDDWQLRRLARVDAQLWEFTFSRCSHLDPTCPLGQAYNNRDTGFARLQRRIDSVHRSYREALNQLNRLLAARPPADPDPAPEPEPLPPEPPIGFVPPLHPIPSDPGPFIGFVPPPAARATPISPMQIHLSRPAL